MIIGGGEDRAGDRAILRRFVELAGGAEARIVVIGTATTVPDEIRVVYQDAFADLCEEMTFLPLGTREEVNDPGIVSLVSKASGVFFTGGDQLRIASILGGSHTDTALHAAYQEGAIIAGTSAGAAMMSTTMILGGDETLPSFSAVRTGIGLGFVSGMVIDMHFAERGRLSRLLAITALFPHELGIGIDEDTAAIVDGSRFEVMGRGAVTVVDAGEVTAIRTPPVGEPGAFAMTGVLLHMLPAGYSFDLSSRTPLITEAPATSHAREAGDLAERVAETRVAEKEES